MKDQFDSRIPIRQFNAADSELLFNELRAWRLNISRINDVPAFVIFHDSVLRAIAQAPIASKADFLSIRGFGPTKYRLYADAIYAIVAKHRHG